MSSYAEILYITIDKFSYTPILLWKYPFELVSCRVSVPGQFPYPWTPCIFTVSTTSLLYSVIFQFWCLLNVCLNGGTFEASCIKTRSVFLMGIDRACYCAYLSGVPILFFLQSSVLRLMQAGELKASFFFHFSSHFVLPVKFCDGMF